MKIEYEGIHFHIASTSSIERNLVKLKIKKSIGKVIRKPYIKDPYLSFCETVLEKSDSPLVVDVGANIGTTVLPLAKRFPNAQFIAIEPHPLPAARFIQNCQFNNLFNVSLVNAAIGSKIELVKIYTCPSNSGGHRVTGFEGRNDFVKLSSLDHVSVLSCPLKNIFNYFKIHHCSMLKIDVEGLECQVIESLGEMLNPSYINVVVAEYGPEGMRKAGKIGWDLVQMMLAKGYRCQELITKKSIFSKSDIPVLPDYAVTDFIFT